VKKLSEMEAEADRRNADTINPENEAEEVEDGELE
jgi:hypothetical protein